jgi:hypothetical protein
VPRPPLTPRVVVPVVGVLLVAGAVAVPRFQHGDAVLDGLPDRPLSATALQSTVVSTPASGGAKLLVDGRAVGQQQGGRLTAPLSGLADGRHTVAVEEAGGLLGGGSRTERTVVVDSTPPVLTVAPIAPVGIRDKVTVTGTVRDAVHLATADGRDVPVGRDGTFTATYPTPPAGDRLVALDAAGNRTTAAVDAPVVHPEMRAVHMTALAWTSRQLRDPILALAKQGKIDTIELDIKDESGLIGFDSQNPLARKAGAVKGYYDAAAVTKQLHGMGLRVVGRLVAFRDPVLAPYAYSHGRKDMVTQDPKGQPYQGKYGGFTNFASADVRKYNIDIAVEAAKLGFDDVLYDYCRRPDGKLSTMQFPGLKESPEKAVAGFMAESRAALRPLGVYVGASVFGIAADRPTQIAQDIPLMSRSLDYIAPMVYPSHWGPGEYGVANPNKQPGPIVERSLKIFQADVKGTPTKIMPWLQDFSLGVHYGPAEVKAQIDAAARAGVDSFLLWNAGARYQGAALVARKG